MLNLKIASKIKKLQSITSMMKDVNESPNNPERVNSNLLLLAQRYRWKGIMFPTNQKNWKKIAKKKALH